MTDLKLTGKEFDLKLTGKEFESNLYKPKEEQTTTCEIKQEDGKIVLDFYSDCGKFGTDEMLDGYKLTPERLLQILQDRDDYTDDEL